MALIGMCVYSTEENKKDDCLEKTLTSLKDTVDFKKHRLQVYVNGMTERTERILFSFRAIIDVIHGHGTNIGTARGINEVWKNRQASECLVKMDDDVVFHSKGWADEMEEAIAREPKIGILGLKRKDVIQAPWETSEWFNSELYMLPHAPGERWIIVEKTADIMGTCVMCSPKLVGAIGGLVQPSVYGFDDSLYSIRSRIAGFYNCFLPHIEIDHIDDGKTPYQIWKENQASEKWKEFQSLVAKYKSGELSIFHPFK